MCPLHDVYTMNIFVSEYAVQTAMTFGTGRSQLKLRGQLNLALHRSNTIHTLHAETEPKSSTEKLKARKVGKQFITHVS